MKKVFVASLLAAASLAPMFAHASDGTLAFQGEVVGSTCTPVGGAGSTQTITMNKASTNNLSNAGDSFLGKKFDVELVNCGPVSKNVQLNFNANLIGINPATGRMLNSAAGGAQNVEVSLRQPAAVSDLFLGSSNAVSQSLPTVVSGANSGVKIPMEAWYVATNGAATGGAVVSQVQFNIGYP